MTTVADFVPYVTRGYGAVELKATYQKNLFRGLAAGIIIVSAAVGSYYVPQLFADDEKPTRWIPKKYIDLGPPPSLQPTAAAPSVAVSSAAVKPNPGTPVPVPDAEVSPDQTIATQKELGEAVGLVGDGANTGGNYVIEPDIEETEPPVFVAYEKEPTVVRKIEPKYPAMAQRVGLEGNVLLKVWVDKEGKVRKAVILKSDAEIFNQAAQDAAVQWVFTPAVMQKGPVSVWVSIPFRFRLQGK